MLRSENKRHTDKSLSLLFFIALLIWKIQFWKTGRHSSISARLPVVFKGTVQQWEPKGKYADWFNDRGTNVKRLWKTSECISSIFFLFLGSFDIQEDHSQEQCQEEEDVRGIHRDAAIAHIIRGFFFFPSLLFVFFCPVTLKCALTWQRTLSIANLPLSAALWEDEGSRRHIFQDLRWIAADHRSGDESPHALAALKHSVVHWLTLAQSQLNGTSGRLFAGGSGRLLLHRGVWSS